MTSELTMSQGAMLAATVNALTGNSDASHLRQSTAQLVGALYAATVGGSSPHLTMSVPAMLAAIRNNVSGDPDVTSKNTSVPALLAQINNAWSDDPDLSAATSSVGKLLAGMLSATPVEGGGGGDESLWSADFENGTYTVAGETAAVTDIFAQNGSWGTWDPDADIEAGVGWNTTNGPVLTGAALASCVAGATYVVEVTVDAPAQILFFDLTTLPGYTPESQVDFGAGSTSLNFTPESTTNSFSPGLDAGPAILAFTATPIHLAASLNGDAVVTLDRAEGSASDILLGGPTSGVITKITAYATVADADLPALSAPAAESIVWTDPSGDPWTAPAEGNWTSPE